MEIVKQNETFQISEKAENGWEMVGTANKDVNGSLSINFNVTKPGGLSEQIGDCNYYKPQDSDRVSVSYNVEESGRDAFAAYLDKVVDTVLAHFNSPE